MGASRPSGARNDNLFRVTICSRGAACHSSAENILTRGFSYVKPSTVRSLSTIHNLREEETVAPRKLVMGVAMGLALLSLAQPGHSQFARHHIGLDIGFFKSFSEDLKIEEPGLSVDFTSGLLSAVNYRYSLNRYLDLAFEVRSWMSFQEWAGVDFTLTSNFIGGGLRVNAGETAVRPYVQANIYIVQEKLSGEADGFRAEAESESGVGLGVIGGVDIEVTDLISIPLEANLLIAEPADNVSGFGFASGINFNFGRVVPK